MKKILLLLACMGQKKECPQFVPKVFPARLETRPSFGM